jgi:NAD(P)H-dependent flavin oxidoreductase YrpB (nitropropane dioxygenase family)
MAGFIKFSNRFTKAFKVKHPIVLAPMGGIAGVGLVSAVSKVFTHK